jgi:hypothetical protein
MNSELREQFRRELGFTENSDSLCKCEFFHMQDAEYIVWLERTLEERTLHPTAQLTEVQARRMAWIVCDELFLNKNEDVATIMGAWKEKQYIK